MNKKSVKIGDQFYDLNKTKHHIVNVFKDGKYEIVTYKFWSKRKQRWYYESDYLRLFMIAFDYGFKWI